MKALALATRTARLIAAAAFYALYGAWTIVKAVLAGIARAGDGVRLLGESLPCPSCRYANPLHGRWRCKCGAVFHGLAVFCPLCAASASFFSCVRCGVSIPLSRTAP